MPNVDGTEFPYTKAGIQKAKAWAEMTGKPMKMKEYKKGGKASKPNKELEDISKWRELMTPTSPIDAEMMQMYSNRWLKSTGQDTLAVDKMLGPKTIKAMDAAKKASGDKKYQLGGEVPAGRRMYGANLRRKPIMQTSQQGMPLRGSEGLQPGSPLMYKKGGKVKMPKGWHV